MEPEVFTRFSRELNTIFFFFLEILSQVLGGLTKNNISQKVSIQYGLSELILKGTSLKPHHHHCKAHYRAQGLSHSISIIKITALDMAASCKNYGKSPQIFLPKFKEGHCFFQNLLPKEYYNLDRLTKKPKFQGNRREDTLIHSVQSILTFYYTVRWNGVVVSGTNSVQTVHARCTTGYHST